MRKIYELPNSLKLLLAAGEVIERPAYIVKELLDNAVDENATAIQIELAGYGLQKIVVTDDGSGMNQQDLKICFKRYTTSKIKEENDLNRIESMGFRGEALSSIAAVATVTINSREKSAVAGCQIVVSNGTISQISAKGMPVGTQVKVEDIFQSIPARKKFLRSQQTEYRHILDVIYKYALAFPSVRFDVYHENKQVHLLVSNELDKRVKALVSPAVYKELLPIEYKKEYIAVNGFTSKPQLSYKSNRHIHIFINNRYIVDTKLISAIKDVYGTLLEPTRYPHIILYLEIPPHLVDVNVHPRKEEVHFVNTDTVVEYIKKSLREVLSQADVKYYDKRWRGDEKEYYEWQIREGSTESYAAKTLKEKVKQSNKLFVFPKNQSYFQFHDLYIAAPTDTGILFFDQHAVHERILYEEYAQLYTEELEKKEHYVLPSTILVEVTPEEYVLLEEHKNILGQIGFSYECLERREVEFIYVPKLFKDRNIQKLLREILDELFEKGERIAYETLSDKMITYLSCRSAIKAGDKITQKQCKELIEKLQKTKQPYTCPHGRPTQVEIDLHYFHKLFKRK